MTGALGRLSGGIAGAYGGSLGQGAAKIGGAAERGALEGVDSFNRTITPIAFPNDPARFIKDMFFQNPDGSWSNGV